MFKNDWRTWLLAALPVGLALGLCAGAAMLASLLAAAQPNAATQIVAHCTQVPNGSVLPLGVFRQTLPARALYLSAHQLLARGPLHTQEWAALPNHYAAHLESLIYHECRGLEIGRQ